MKSIRSLITKIELPFIFALIVSLVFVIVKIITIRTSITLLGDVYKVDISFIFWFIGLFVLGVYMERKGNLTRSKK